MKRVNVVLGDQEVRALAKLARERLESGGASGSAAVRTGSNASARIEATSSGTALIAPSRPHRVRD